MMTGRFVESFERGQHRYEPGHIAPLPTLMREIGTQAVHDAREFGFLVLDLPDRPLEGGQVIRLDALDGDSFTLTIVGTPPMVLRLTRRELWELEMSATSLMGVLRRQEDLADAARD